MELGTYTQTLEPLTEPVTLTEAKLYARVDANDDNDLLTGLIKTARHQVEHFTGRQLVTATWRLDCRTFPSDTQLRLERCPLVEVTSVKYYDAANVQQTVAATDYIVQTGPEPGFIELKTDRTWPTGLYDRADAVQVVFKAGYGTAASVPADLKQAIKILINHLYEQREPVAYGITVAEVPLAYRNLVWSYRVGL